MRADLLRARVGLDEATLAAFCRKWRVAELAIFGSAPADDFTEDSDIDVLVTFQADSGWSLWEVMRMRDELARLAGRDVDLIERAVVERSRNYIRRASILSSPQVIYGA